MTGIHLAEPISSGENVGVNANVKSKPNDNKKIAQIRAPAACPSIG
eukprot:CAMPEP_0116876436 /NCGR_PEP_ID=MMETSP0463-20121206/8376_1 /TAXON_ID=181622 /ORGANISM="Strombidinopsis sp, Strain SopsisLIS2011" /LENGTH=45 /DNA_ID= /DNA_START= /DNA_END= /DNA_ORIENTATION=